MGDGTVALRSLALWRGKYKYPSFMADNFESEIPMAIFVCFKEKFSANVSYKVFSAVL